MAYLKDNMYWKIVDITINRQEKKANVTVQGFVNKEAADLNHRKAMTSVKNRRHILLDKKLFPFVNDANPNMLGLTYKNIAVKDKYFTNAEEI